MKNLKHNFFKEKTSVDFSKTYNTIGKSRDKGLPVYLQNISNPDVTLKVVVRRLSAMDVNEERLFFADISGDVEVFEGSALIEELPAHIFRLILSQWKLKPYQKQAGDA